MGPFIPLRRELPMTITLLSFLAEAVLRYGIKCFTLDNLLGGPFTAFSLTSSSSSRPSNYSREIPGKSKGRGACQAGTCFHSSSLKSPPSAQWWQGRGSTTVWSISPQCLSHKFSKELLHQSTSCLHSPMLFNVPIRHSLNQCCFTDIVYVWYKCGLAKKKGYRKEGITTILTGTLANSQIMELLGKSLL